MADKIVENLSGSDVTRILNLLSDHDRAPASELLPLVYRELRALAHNYLANERRDHTLQATALVHEAYVKIAKDKGKGWESRRHFYRMAAAIMRHILVDHARNRGRLKRGGHGERLPLDEAVLAFEKKAFDLVALDEALEKLTVMDKNAARVVELRFFGGQSVEETANVLGVTPRTVKTYWATAKLWLFRAMNGP